MPIRHARAFTLIELLVVIAIISILAAILFPVFAQAKNAAKKAVAISNTKQENLAIQMYGSDAEDVAPLSVATRYAKGNPNCAAASDCGTATWIDAIQPYAKSYDFVFDPVSQYQVRGGYGFFGQYLFQVGALPIATAVSGGAFQNYVTRDGSWYNNVGPGNLSYDGIMGIGTDPSDTYWSAYPGFGAGKSYSSRSLTSINVAQYALLFSSNSFDGFHGIVGQQVGFGNCSQWPGFDLSFMGFQARHTGGSAVCDPKTRAADYGTGMAVIGFGDGHVKAMKPANLVQDDGNGNMKFFSPNAQ